MTTQIIDKTTSLILKSLMLVTVPVMTPIMPSAGKLSPSKALTCVEQIVIAAALVNPLITGLLMKFMMNPKD